MASLPPPTAEYGADEISALVLDPGYSVTRAGFAGEDTPKSVIPSYYGALEKEDGPKYVFDDNSIHSPLPNLDIRNPMAADGTVENWELATKLWEHAMFSKLLGPKESRSIRSGTDDEKDGDVEMQDVELEEKPLTESPLLMTEPGWNPQKNREKALELAMEDWGCPAFWLGRSGVLSAFASGKPSALVIDIGASTTSMTPVFEGMMLKKGTVKSPLAGNWISEQTRLMFAEQKPLAKITPHYLVSSKSAVDAGAPANATYRSFENPPKQSYRHLQEERVLMEFKESCVQVWNPARHGSFLSCDPTRNPEPARPFEFPDGWNNLFGLDRFKVIEGLFDEKAAYSTTTSPAPPHAQTLPVLTQSSLNAIDVDTRSQILNNVVVTGGSSLVQGMTDRIHHELQTLYPGARVKITAPGNVAERKFAAWIGGSILASLGSFHQMWISKKEYEENGVGIVEKRCK